MEKLTREEKLARFFKAQEHPEQFTDDELQAMLDDEDIREEIITMRKIRNSFNALHSEECGASLSEECGVRSEELYAEEESNSKSNNSSPHTPHSSLKIYSSLQKVAAMFVGCILLAGIAYAAVRFVKEREPMPIVENEATDKVEKKVENTAIVEPADTIAKPNAAVTFDNEELATILGAMSEYYQVKVVFESEQAKHIRLFLVWDKTQPVTEIVEMLNKYERFDIALADNTLTVK